MSTKDLPTPPAVASSAAPEPESTAAASSASIPLSSNLQNTDSAAFQTGLSIRSEVMSPAFASRALSNTTPFAAPLQELVTSFAWGQVWSRPELSFRDRSLINLALLTALNRHTELAGHVRGALRNGVSRDEIREVLVHCAVYCGFPAALDAGRTVERVLDEVEREQQAQAAQAEGEAEQA